MVIKRILSLITAVLECLFFSGLLFGWASIRSPLEKECYFGSYCEVYEHFAAVPTTVADNTFEWNTTTVADTIIEWNTSWNYEDTVTRPAFTGIASEAVFSATDTGEVEVDECPTCKPQAEQLNLVFTVASTVLSLSTLLNGYIYDKFGTWISRAIAILLFTVGCVLMSVSSAESSWLLFPSMSCFSVGGILLLVTNLQVGNLFGRLRSSVITMLSGALDSSSSVFLVFKILYDKDVPLSTVFNITCGCTIFMWARTFFLLPRRHIPFPMPKDYDYGIKECGFSRQKNVDKEMVILHSQKQEPDARNDVAPENVKTASFLACVRTSMFWTNVTHFSLLQLRNYFFMSSLYDWLLDIAGDREITISYLVAFGTCQLFGIVFAPMNGLLIDTVTRVLHKRAASKDVVPLKAVMFSGIATTALGTLFSIIIVIPSLPLQYVSFILQVVFRSFLYGGSMSFIAIAFPVRHFGKLYGLTMALGGIISLLQFPLFTLVLRQLDGNFFVVNLIFVFVSLFTLLHPANVWMQCKSLEKHDRGLHENDPELLLSK